MIFRIQILDSKKPRRELLHRWSRSWTVDWNCMPKEPLNAFSWKIAQNSNEFNLCHIYAIFMPYLCHIYAIFMPYLCHIFAIFMPYLCHIYAIFMPYLCHIYAIFMPYLCHIYAIFLPYLCHIYAIFMPYFCHIYAIFMPYFCHIYAIFMPYSGEKEKKSAKQSELQGDDTEEWILNNPVIDYVRVQLRVAQGSSELCHLCPIRRDARAVWNTKRRHLCTKISECLGYLILVPRKC